MSQTSRLASWEQLTMRSRLFSIVRFGLLLALQLVALRASAQERVTFFVNDALGSPVLATDQRGSVAWRGDYAPFGQLISQTKAIPANPRWIGTHADPESGLLAMGRRSYHPSLGRFLSPDGALIGDLPASAVATPAYLNYYAYGLNNPQRFVDPHGDYPTDPQAQVDTFVSDLGNVNTVVGAATVAHELGKLPYQAIFGGGGAGLTTVSGVAATAIGLGAAAFGLYVRASDADTGIAGNVISYIGDIATAVSSASVAAELGKLPLAAIYGGGGAGAATVIGVTTAVVGAGTVGYRVGSLVNNAFAEKLIDRFQLGSGAVGEWYYRNFLR